MSHPTVRLCELAEILTGCGAGALEVVVDVVLLVLLGRAIVPTPAVALHHNHHFSLSAPNLTIHSFGLRESPSLGQFLISAFFTATFLRKYNSSLISTY